MLTGIPGLNLTGIIPARVLAGDCIKEGDRVAREVARCLISSDTEIALRTCIVTLLKTLIHAILALEP